MTSSVHHRTTTLAPISLRKAEGDKHPLEMLKPVAESSRAEARRQAHDLREALTSTVSTIDSIGRVSQAANEGREAGDRKPGRSLIRLILNELPEQFEKLRNVLTTNPGTQAIPELRDVVQLCDRILTSDFTGRQSADLYKQGEKLAENYSKVSKDFDAAGDRLLICLNSLAPATALELGPLLIAVLNQVEDSDEGPSGFAPLRMMRNKCQKLRRRYDLPEDQGAILSDIIKTLTTMEQLERDVTKASLELHQWSQTSINRIKEVLNNLNVDQISAVAGSFEAAFEERLIQATTRALIAPYLDPSSTSASEQIVDTERWLPVGLRNAVSGLGINASGDVVPVEPHGNVQKLVETLATLLEQDSPALFTEGHINRRLAPVLRAALPEAQALVISRIEQREQEVAERTRAEQRIAHEVAEAREFASFAFDEIFETSQAKQTNQREELRSTFLLQYPALSAIELRQDKLTRVSQELSLPEAQLKGELEWYLLSDKQVDRWAKDVGSLQEHLVQQLGNDAYLMIYDASNFLPSALPGLMKQYFSEK